MIQIGVQTKNIVYDSDPVSGFALMKEAGFDCADFSLNSYLSNASLYKLDINNFFEKSDAGMEAFFMPHKKGAKEAGILIHQMHMPYPNYVPGGDKQLNDYLWNVVAPQSMKICAFFECPYIVIHGFKTARNVGGESAEWEQTEKFLEFLAPMAMEYGITMCVENIYNSVGEHIVEGPCCNAKKAAERIDRINDKYGEEVIGFCFDTGHGNLVGLDMEEFIVTLGHRLKVLHIHDNDGVGDLHQLPFTFSKNRENKTSTDWEGFLRGLQRIHFNQVLSFETAPVLNAFPEEMRQEVLAFIAKIGKYFVKKLEGVIC